MNSLFHSDAKLSLVMWHPIANHIVHIVTVKVPFEAALPIKAALGLSDYSLIQCVISKFQQRF